MKNANRKGFTLIELLIVIAIIGILAAVLIPNLLQARTRAFETAAQACAKGVSTAAEIRNIDTQSYAGLTFALIEDNGGNACVDNTAGAAPGPAGAQVLAIDVDPGTSYSVLVSHSNSATLWCSTPDGIDTVAAAADCTH